LATGRTAPGKETSDFEIAPPVVTRGAPDRRAIALIAHAEDGNGSIAPPHEALMYRSSIRIEASPDAGSVTQAQTPPLLTIRQPDPASPREDEESPRSPRELRTQTVIRERAVINEVLRRGEPERGGARNGGDEAESPLPAPKRPATSLPIVGQPRVAPLSEYRSGEKIGRGAEKSAPAPTIHVTIGRVEVRATQVTSQSTPKPRPASHTMSLDDYLRRRGEGGAK
jgi:hypothetical protein